MSLMNKLSTDEYLTIEEYFKDKEYGRVQLQTLGKQATKICKDANIEIIKVEDDRYPSPIGSYPITVLQSLPAPPKAEVIPSKFLTVYARPIIAKNADFRFDCTFKKGLENVTEPHPFIKGVIEKVDFDYNPKKNPDNLFAKPTNEVVYRIYMKHVSEATIIYRSPENYITKQIFEHLYCQQPVIGKKITLQLGKTTVNRQMDGMWTSVPSEWAELTMWLDGVKMKKLPKDITWDALKITNWLKNK